MKTASSDMATPKRVNFIYSCHDWHFSNELSQLQETWLSMVKSLWKDPYYNLNRTV